ncbi:PC4-domain-containing protein [Dissoconium aciculare CBS 342.82]|uniref:PC4-domain-containing protein n=1 Tax=Dissoconium aciculare CBS 342.82 TaxID=1314786 RepID=A0A6J3LXU2_9PEZI|nr:PC4-domain-containing protein [Dissoconium aciculare CBS 342.82]KAF1820498.1 PC4-domain-containing protein [Dissoconium aciculare CBS 342.82]
MPKPSASRKRAAEEDYDSDDGFVEKENGKAPKAKKTKSSSNGDSAGALVDDDGNEYWEISAKRRVQVSQFGKGTFVNIREFYEANGKTLPGKKGIALPIEQFNALVELLPEIEKALKPKAGDLPISRPRYDEEGPKSAAASNEQKESKEPVASDEDETVGDDKKGKHNDRPQKRQKQKANHEATSSEDEG